MKTILVLSDLSKKAENAALYAMKLAEKMHANILLYHSYENYQSVNAPESGALLFDDYELIKNDSLAELEHLASILRDSHNPYKFKPQIELLSVLGYDLGTNVQQLAEDKNIDLIVMGTKSNDKLSHIFFGSDCKSVVDKTPSAVLFVPDDCKPDGMKTIVFCNDMKKRYLKQASFLVDMARADQARIIVTYVGEDDPDPENSLHLIQDTLEYPNAIYRKIHGRDIELSISRFAEAVEADLTVMIHHQRAALEKWISSSRSKGMLNHHHGPLLILPD